MIKILNWIRSKYNLPEVIEDMAQSILCKQHSDVMSQEEKLFDSKLEPGWREVIARCPNHSNSYQVELWITEILDNSQIHREAILGSKILSVGKAINKDMIYITIRGRVK